MSAAPTSSPYIDAARPVPIAAVSGSRSSPSIRAASAVELAATTSTPASLVDRNRRHCAVACGIDTTRRMSASALPGTSSRLSWIEITTSRVMRRSDSKARVSRVTLTVPSIEFSTGTKPTSTSPASVAARTSLIDAIGTRSPAARSFWVSSACSVNVPGGPRNPTRGRVPGSTAWADIERAG